MVRGCLGGMLLLIFGCASPKAPVPPPAVVDAGTPPDERAGLVWEIGPLSREPVVAGPTAYFVDLTETLVVGVRARTGSPSGRSPERKSLPAASPSTVTSFSSRSGPACSRPPRPHLPPACCSRRTSTAPCL